MGLHPGKIHHYPRHVQRMENYLDLMDQIMDKAEKQIQDQKVSKQEADNTTSNNEAKPEVKIQQNSGRIQIDFLRSLGLRPLDLIDQILDIAEKQIQVSKQEEQYNHEVDNTTKNEAKPEVKKLLTCVKVQENNERMNIQIDFLGRKFHNEQLEVQIINGTELVIKAKNDENDKRKFKLPLNCQIEKIESKLNSKEEEKQSLIVSVPKDVKIVQVPIAMEE